AEGTYGLVYEATIQHYKVHDNASFTQGEEPEPTPTPTPEPEPTPTPTPEPDDERGCLIATAAYESPLAPQVAYLRHLRDDGLRRSKTGAAIVDGWESIYYKFSPYVAEAMRRSPQFKRFMRWLVVSPIVHLLMAIFKPFRRQIK
ncbi:MAG: CFI-box-CTERM domain-containing protein, partial [Candidatus Hodarchaeota archaeon]